MDNRRNFYRILRVQPDASHTVIQQSYRSLMQKLQLHPDLGGEQWDASIVNQAYAVLRDPKKRAAYDVELLSRYNVQVLSTGGMEGPKNSTGKRSSDDTINSRNYYRVLHVQPDAELEVVIASYRALMKISSDSERVLIEEAFAVIRDPGKRQRYIRLLAENAHAEIIDNISRDDLANYLNETVENAGTDLINVESKGQPASRQSFGLIHQYCHFCKTPYSPGGLPDVTVECMECASPLTLPTDNFSNTPRRSLVRMQQSAPASCYEFWPSAPTRVSLEDLSPAGLNFKTTQDLDINQVLKIDAAQFKSVAKVAHCTTESGHTSVGARFLAVEFLRPTGSFFSTSA